METVAICIASPLIVIFFFVLFMVWLKSRDYEKARILEEEHIWHSISENLAGIDMLEKIRRTPEDRRDALWERYKDYSKKCDDAWNKRVVNIIKTEGYMTEQEEYELRNGINPYK